MTAQSQDPATPGAAQDDRAATAPEGRANPQRKTEGKPGREADAPILPAGEDVRIGPDQSDQPQAGAAEPTD
jgi:hypothetical protein